MSSIYSDALHKFVESYMNITGATIIENNDEFFVAQLADGTKDFFTYLPRIAAENKEFKLIAKGSRWLQDAIKECNLKSAFSEIEVKNTDTSIKCALSQKKCCDLCPFSIVCESNDTCCHFCYNYKKCNSHLKNAEFVATSSIKGSENVDLVFFVFFVEISNDYSLSQKVSKTVAVLIDIRTGEVIDNLLLNDIASLDFAECEKGDLINSDNYPKILRKARKEASKTVSRHLEVFRKNIEDVLGEKIKSIINKFEEDYIDNYTTSTLAQLQDIQEEGLKLCEREIRGYTINCDYHLKSVSIFHAQKDSRDIILRHKQSGKELTVAAEVFLTGVDLKCTQCGMEIDKGVLCEDGHMLCRNCMEVCSICDHVICDICDNESYVCATCGDLMCEGCSTKCSECDSLQCMSHIYKCDICGKMLCVDCYEICKDCGKSVCKENYAHCEHCGESVCLEHAHKCSICSKHYCIEHIEKCQVCTELICYDDTYYSAYSGRAVCEMHLLKCDICSDLFASDEIKECSECNEKLCPNHVKTCSKCTYAFCSDHVNYCRSCGKEYCDCTGFVKCKFCQEEYCEFCIDKNGYCKTCSELEWVPETVLELENIFKLIPELSEYKKFYLGKSKEIRSLYARGLFRNLLVVYNIDGTILSARELSFMENLKRKNRIFKRS